MFFSASTRSFDPTVVGSPRMSAISTSRPAGSCAPSKLTASLTAAEKELSAPPCAAASALLVRSTPRKRFVAMVTASRAETTSLRRFAYSEASLSVTCCSSARRLCLACSGP
eukprot:1857456-Rhodomonas_salina.1